MHGTDSAVLIFVRAPALGQVKTRLAAEIGAEAALRVYMRLAQHTVEEARRLAPAATVRIHFTPEAAAEQVRGWLGGGVEYLPQEPGGLGERLRGAFQQAFVAGFERVIVIGSDLPQLSSDLLRHALHLLDQHDVVLGPARDGGYYLLGLRRPVPGVFEDIAWSTGKVFAQTRDRLRSAGIEPALLEMLNDVDEAGDLPPGWP